MKLEERARVGGGSEESRERGGVGKKRCSSREGWLKTAVVKTKVLLWYPKARGGCRLLLHQRISRRHAEAVREPRRLLCRIHCAWGGEVPTAVLNPQGGEEFFFFCLAGAV